MGRALIAGVLGVFLSVAALTLPFESAAAGMREGVEAYKRGDFAGALKEWLPLAEQGNPNALYNVAQLYRTGKGVPKDVPMAEKFYREAAERGHVAAQGNLGTLYYFAFPDSPRVKPAFEWWEKAARNGDGRSQYMMGVMLYNGTHIARDPVRAYAWMRLASASGIPEAVKAEKEMSGVLSAREVSDGTLLADQLVPQQTTIPVPSSSGGAITLADMKRSPEKTSAGETAAVAEAPKPAASPKPAANLKPAASPKPVVRPKPAPDAKGGGDGFYVQVSASGSEASSEKLRAKLEKQGGLNGASVRLSPTRNARGATIYRVQVGPYAAREAADRQCAAFKQRRQGCFVVRD